MLTYYPACPEDTADLARSFAATLQPGSVLCFFGDLGAGKTTFVKALTEALGGKEHEVNSPTFQYLNIYRGSLPLFHFDLYRLRDAEEFLESGFHEFFSQGGIVCIEWAESIMSLLPSVLPDNSYSIHISHVDNASRKVEISKVEISKRSPAARLLHS